MPRPNMRARGPVGGLRNLRAWFAWRCLRCRSRWASDGCFFLGRPRVGGAGGKPAAAAELSNSAGDCPFVGRANKCTDVGAAAAGERLRDAMINLLVGRPDTEHYPNTRGKKQE